MPARRRWRAEPPQSTSANASSSHLYLERRASLLAEIVARCGFRRRPPARTSTLPSRPRGSTTHRYDSRFRWRAIAFRRRRARDSSPPRRAARRRGCATMPAASSTICRSVASALAFCFECFGSRDPGVIVRPADREGEDSRSNSGALIGTAEVGSDHIAAADRQRGKPRCALAGGDGGLRGFGRQPRRGDLGAQRTGRRNGRLRIQERRRDRPEKTAGDRRFERTWSRRSFRRAAPRSHCHPRLRPTRDPPAPSRLRRRCASSSCGASPACARTTAASRCVPASASALRRRRRRRRAL